MAWLTGDESKIDPDSWAEYDLWCLKHGFASRYKDRPIDAEELLEKYGHLASTERRKYLELQLERMNRRPMMKGGKLVYVEGRHEYTRNGQISRHPFKTAEISPLKP